MLVNYKDKFIFLRPQFCGSTSTEFVLSKFCKSKKDIITPISFPAELKRRKLNIYPQNYETNIFEKIYNLSVLLNNRKISDYFLVKGKNVFLKNHSKIDDFIKLRNDNIFDFTIITISRHPYEKALSQAKWSLVKHKYLKQGIKIIPFPDEIIQSLKQNYESERLKGINNWPIYTHRGKYIVDILIEYNDLDIIDKILNEKFNFGSFKLPQLKKHYEKNHVTPSMIPFEIKNYIQNICSEEFKKFSYEA